MSSESFRGGFTTRPLRVTTGSVTEAEAGVPTAVAREGASELVLQKNNEVSIWSRTVAWKKDKERSMTSMGPHHENYPPPLPPIYPW